MTEVETTEPEAPVAAEPLRCPRCSSAVEPLQEYCLDCGLRLPREHLVPPDAADPATRRSLTGGWLSPALIGLAIALLGTVAAIAISDAGESAEVVPTATGGSITATTPPPTLTAPEPPAPPATTAPPPATTPPATTAPPPPPATIAWPAGRRGWTIVLLSVPQASGRPAAEAKAAEARRSGLQDVGILNSSRFASLRPGYFVVFTGVFDSQPEATSALPRARSAFPLAYGRQIVP